MGLSSVPPGARVRLPDFPVLPWDRDDSTRLVTFPYYWAVPVSEGVYGI